MKARLIARLDIKGENLIKGIQLEGLRVIGDPNSFARKYFESGIDEFIFMDSVASLYGRNQLGSIIERITENIFVPITVGGGLRSLDDCRKALRSGADKVAINTAALNNHEIISKVAKEFGSQCMVVSIDAKKINESAWHAYVNNGRESTGVDAVEWAIKCEELGAGEILVTSIDKEGTRSGFDINLIEKITNNVSIPVIASGGFGKPSHLVDLLKKTKVNAVAVADALHYSRYSITELREIGIHAGREMREID
jgi:cyclase